MKDEEPTAAPSRPDGDKPARNLPWFTADEFPPPPPEMRRPPGEVNHEPSLFDEMEAVESDGEE